MVLKLAQVERVSHPSCESGADEAVGTPVSQHCIVSSFSCRFRLLSCLLAIYSHGSCVVPATFLPTVFWKLLKNSSKCHWNNNEVR